VERPICLEHGPDAYVVRAGWYGREGQRRQRWVCKPDRHDRATWHRFAEVLPRMGTPGHSRECDECATELEAWEGQPAPRLYGFHARDIAAALVLVAGGWSYRAAAERTRIAAGRPLSRDRTRSEVRSGRRAGKRTTLPSPNRHGQLVSDWVDTFAEVIWRHYAATEWPEAIVVDAAALKYRGGDTLSGNIAFHTLVAIAPGGQVVHIEAVPVENEAAWLEFYQRLPGVPRLVVGDEGRALGAAEKFFPDALPYACEWHLSRKVERAVGRSLDPADPLRDTIRNSYVNRASWERMVHEVHVRLPRNRLLHRRITEIGAVLDAQRTALATLELRAAPHSTGAAEQYLTRLGHQLHGRASNMTNQQRTNALLKLLAAGHNKWADERTWAGLIRDHLAERDGLAPPQRQHSEKRGENSLAIVRDTPAVVRRKRAKERVEREHREALEAANELDESPF
jgi:hypothetical protein